MSSEEKSGDKSVDSTPKSKTASVAGKVAEQPGVVETTDKAKSSVVKSVAKAPVKQDRNAKFNTGPRVWPD